jgi:hypothetical protein
MRQRFATVVISLLTLSACADDSAPDLASDAATDTATDAGADGSADEGSAGPVCSPQYADGCAADEALCGDIYTPSAFRVTNLVIRKPSGVGTLLANLVNRDIRSGFLHVLIETTQVSAARPDVDFRLGVSPGCIADAGCAVYGWDPNGLEAGLSVPAPSLARSIGATAFDGVEPFGFNFPVVAASDPPDPANLRYIPLGDILSQGVVTEGPDGRLEVSGSLKGAILKSGCNVELVLAPGSPGTPVCQLLGGDATMNYPPGVPAAERTGWIFESEFETERVTLRPGATCATLP